MQAVGARVGAQNLLGGKSSLFPPCHSDDRVAHATLILWS